MPTPSSNPPNPTAPRSPSFSTCPEDIQRPSHSSRQLHDAVEEQLGQETQQDLSMNAVSPPAGDAPSAPEGLASEDVMIFETQTSDEPSSREATMSPRPQSNTTGFTSPIPSAPDVELIKGQEAEIGTQLSRETSHGAHNANDSEGSIEAQTTGSCLIEQETPPIDADAQEDDLWSPSMGADYSSMRVSACPSISCP